MWHISTTTCRKPPTCSLQLLHLSVHSCLLNVHFEGVEVGCQVRVHHSLQKWLQDACDACAAQQLHLHSILEAGLSLFTLQQVSHMNGLALGAFASGGSEGCA